MNTLDLVKSNEGFRAHVYCDKCGKPIERDAELIATWMCGPTCPGGKLTIGYGTLLEGVGLSEDEATTLMLARVLKATAHLEQWGWFLDLADPRKAALTDMVYQLGAHGFDQFTALINACANALWDKAAAAVMASLYARQAPRRAQRNAELLRSGTW